MSNKISVSHLSILEQEREHTLTELEHLRAELRIGVEHDDIDDIASDLIEREKTHAFILALERKLKDIEHAIKLTQEVGYGICEKCGKKINPERLEIFPETTLCVDCKRASERFINSRRV